MSYSKETKVSEIVKDPKLQDILPYILPVHPKLMRLMMGKKSLEEVCLSLSGGVYNASDMADGFSLVKETADKKEEFVFPLYSRKEIRMDKRKRAAGLLRFSVPGSSRFVILCAGGGYKVVANMAESLPVANRLVQEGITAYVLNYRVNCEYTPKFAYEDLRKAIRFCLAKEAEKDYAVIGFSAGAHLAAGLITDNHGIGSEGLKQPGLVGLAYPLVNWRLPVRKDDPLCKAYRRMFGRSTDYEMAKEYHIPSHLKEDAPLVFVWQTKEDELVPFSDNTELLCEEMKKKGMIYRKKIVEHGRHGLGLGTGSEAEGWVEEALGFWKDYKR